MKKALNKAVQYLVLFLFAISSALNPGNAQKVVNGYAKVESIFNKIPTNVDSVKITNLSVIEGDTVKFDSGDVVLFIVMKGAEVYLPWEVPSLMGIISNWHNIGIYNILLVYSYSPSDSIVVFTTSLRELAPMRLGEVAQLVKIGNRVDNYRVDIPLTCKQWDPVEGTGGILALFAGRRIILNNTIDVSGKGFLGGDPNSPTQDNFTGICSEAVGWYYTETADDSAGRRGESVVYEGFPYTRGRLFVASGGGGGNGKYSGGGGGGNYGFGGQAGKESASCSPGTNNLGGMGSYLSNFYKNTGIFRNRIFMGGGGGTGTQNPGSNRSATKGGNGGGIIILITDTIEAISSQTIRARGESVTNMASAGAGGGGGGGVIVLEATGYNTRKGNLTFDVKGGDGGWTNNADKTGPGGFGGAGIIWHSGSFNLSSLPGITVNLSYGKEGRYSPTDSWGASESKTSYKGYVEDSLRIPLSGFLFNVMPADMDICQGDAPILMASTPKGGDGPGTYTYEWMQSSDAISWDYAPGTYTNKDYYAEPQTSTTYLRRIVNSGGVTGTYDTSLILTVHVLPWLEHNDIAPDDIICYGSEIPPIKDDPFFNLIGGTGKYKYSWQSSSDLVSWDSVPGRRDSILQYEIPLDTIYYRRIVNSHVCWDTSNFVTIIVLDTISDNEIYTYSKSLPNDSICQFENAKRITGLLPKGGDHNYNYYWQSSLNNKIWKPLIIPPDSQNYDPDTLKTTRYYRRLVISGSDDVCRDTSNIVNILVHPLITNNEIARDTVICMDDPDLQLIQKSGVVGGGNGFYKYFWQSKLQAGLWQETDNEVTLPGYLAGYIEETTLYRRYVKSGACVDTSKEIKVIVQDSIMNNEIVDNDTICKDAIPAPITGTVPTGGDQNPKYQWEISLESTVWAIVQDSIRNEFSPPSLSDTTYYRRKVISGKCIHYSDPVVMIVQAPIDLNIIKNGQNDETCYETTLDMDGTAGITEMTGGDKESYLYGWQKSTDDQDWSPAPGINNLENYKTEELLLPSYYRRFVVSGACTDTSASTLVSINPRPTAEIPSEEYLNECYDSKTGPVEVNIHFSATGTPPFRIVSFNKFEYDTVENIQTNNDGNGSFTDYLTTSNIDTFNIKIVELMDGNGCFAYPDSLQGMVTMTVYKKPDIHITGDDMVQVCGDMVQLEAEKDVGTGYWMEGMGDNKLTVDDSVQLVIQASTQHGSGNSKYYKLYRTGKNWPVSEEKKCESRDSVEVIFWKEPEAANAGSKSGAEFDTIIYFADHMYLYANPPTAGSGKWEVLSGSASIVNDTLYNTLINLGDQNLDEPAEYQLKWTVTNGICQATSDELKISRKDLRIYDGFSPDGNSINEFFTIGGLDYADTWELKIFSKSGNLIRKFKKALGEEGPEEDRLWDGTYDGGRPVESGIYYYILEVTKGDNTPYNYKGFIVIARERE